jgi:hypothetical protein
LKEEAVDRTMWRAHFGRGFWPVIRQTTKWMSLLSSWAYFHVVGFINFVTLGHTIFV